MNNQLTTIQPEASLGLVRRAEEMILAGITSGNFGLVTSSRVCRAIATMDDEEIEVTLLEEMGIRADVEIIFDSVILNVPDRHSVAAIMNACRTFFDVFGGMGRDGRKAVRVIIPETAFLRTPLITHGVITNLPLEVGRATTNANQRVNLSDAME